MDLRERGLSAQRIYDGRVIKLRVDTVELPNGRQATREIIEHPGAVCIAALTADERIVLVRQYRRPIDEVILEAPAGKLDKDEDPLACAKRELQEETGYRASSWHLISRFYTTPGFCDEIMFLYVAKDLEQAGQSLDEDEFVQVEYMPLQEARDLVLEGKLNDGKTMLAVLAAWSLK